MERAGIATQESGMCQKILPQNTPSPRLHSCGGKTMHCTKKRMHATSQLYSHRNIQETRPCSNTLLLKGGIGSDQYSVGTGVDIILGGAEADYIEGGAL